MADARLRFGLAELLLVQPGATAFLLPPGPDAPGVRVALELAAQGPDVDPTPVLMAQPRPLTAAHVYGLARRPEELWAPPPWPQELALVLGELAIDAFMSRPARLRTTLRRFPLFASAAYALYKARERAERRQARRLGVTPATAPRPAVALPWLLNAGLALYGLARVAGARPRRPPWSLSGASLAIRQLNRRRAWRRAYAASATSAQARSSASSSTSAGCAPDTP